MNFMIFKNQFHSDTWSRRDAFTSRVFATRADAERYIENSAPSARLVVIPYSMTVR